MSDTAAAECVSSILWGEIEEEIVACPEHQGRRLPAREIFSDGIEPRNDKAQDLFSRLHRDVAWRGKTNDARFLLRRRYLHGKHTQHVPTPWW